MVSNLFHFVNYARFLLKVTLEYIKMYRKNSYTLKE